MPRNNPPARRSSRIAGATESHKKTAPYRSDVALRTGRNSVRIIGGEWRGRKLYFPSSPTLRPTPDRVRETLFNWLQASVPGARCLDLFAGSGALGIEALSRGAREVVFVETDAKAARQIAEMLETLKCDRGRVIRVDAFDYLSGTPEPFDLVFLDPPFADRILGRACAQLEEHGWVRSGTVVYMEDAAAAGLPELPAGWEVLRSKRAGEVGYHLARRQ